MCEFSLVAHAFISFWQTLEAVRDPHELSDAHTHILVHYYTRYTYTFSSSIRNIILCCWSERTLSTINTCCDCWIVLTSLKIRNKPKWRDTAEIIPTILGFKCLSSMLGFHETNGNEIALPEFHDTENFYFSIFWKNIYGNDNNALQLFHNICFTLFRCLLASLICQSFGQHRFTNSFLVSLSKWGQTVSTLLLAVCISCSITCEFHWNYWVAPVIYWCIEIIIKYVCVC